METLKKLLTNALGPGAVVHFSHPVTHETGDYVDTLLMQSLDVHRLIPVGFRETKAPKPPQTRPLCDCPASVFSQQCCILERVLLETSDWTSKLTLMFLLKYCCHHRDRTVKCISSLSLYCCVGSAVWYFTVSRGWGDRRAIPCLHNKSTELKSLVILL